MARQDGEHVTSTAATELPPYSIEFERNPTATEEVDVMQNQFKYNLDEISISVP
jgi:hypothetical protein